MRVDPFLEVNVPPHVRPALAFDDVLLVPQRTSLSSRREADLSTVLVPGRLSLCLPIVSANTPWCTETAMAVALGQAGGLGVIHRMQPVEQQARMIHAVADTPATSATATQSPNGTLVAAAAVGVNKSYLDRTGRLVDSGATVIVVDVAHGHSDQMVTALRAIRARHPDVVLIAGNVATPQGYRDLADSGADVIKVGIGPGSICTTREVAGAGVPQLTAVMDAAGARTPGGPTIIADGGIRSSGDMVKALAGGASAIMLGSMLAGVDESAALLIEHEGRRYKTTTGFVTFGVELTIRRAEGGAVSEQELADYVPEGIEATFPYRGPLDLVLRQYAGGLRSGLSYSGSADLGELWSRAEFVQITSGGKSESRPHAVEGAPQVQGDFRDREPAVIGGSS
ncbi:MAG: IMP dehydrogenase [Gordonia polyisoprenivorans]|nr:IMP dehydrogenase [Gordonia polyisoprenivorans]